MEEGLLAAAERRLPHPRIANAAHNRKCHHPRPRASPRSPVQVGGIGRARSVSGLVPQYTLRQSFVPSLTPNHPRNHAEIAFLGLFLCAERVGRTGPTRSKDGIPQRIALFTPLRRVWGAQVPGWVAQEGRPRRGGLRTHTFRKAARTESSRDCRSCNMGAMHTAEQHNLLLNAGSALLLPLT